MNSGNNIYPPEGIRLGPMRFMYALTAVGAMSLGLMMTLTPELLTGWLGWVLDEPLFPGAYGGCLIAFGILCALGFRSPIKYAPVLFFQFTYKSAWFFLVWLPLWFKGELPDYHLIYTIAMVGAILVDVYAVPFGYLFKKESSSFKKESPQLA